MVTKAKSRNNLTEEFEDSADPLPPPPKSAPPYPLPRTLSKDLITIECPFASDQHDGREVFNTVVNMSAEAVYKILFVDDNFMRSIYAERQYRDIEYTNWEKDASDVGLHSRTLSYTAVLPSRTLGPATSAVTEVQTISAMGKYNDLFVVNAESWSSGIPYADSFRIHVHYCILKEFGRPANKPACRLAYYANINYVKNTFFVARNLIEKNVMAGLENVAKDILNGLIAHSQGTTGQKRRRKISEMKVTATIENDGGNKGKSRSSFCTWIVFLFLILIGGMNAYLYKRLMSLENQKSPVIHFSQEEIAVDRDGNLNIMKLIEEQNDVLDWYDEELSNQMQDSLNAINKAEGILKSALSTLPAYEAQRRRFLLQWRKYLENNEEYKQSNSEDIQLDPSPNQVNSL